MAVRIACREPIKQNVRRRTTHSGRGYRTNTSIVERVPLPRRRRATLPAVTLPAPAVGRVVPPLQPPHVVANRVEFVQRGRGASTTPGSAAASFSKPGLGGTASPAATPLTTTGFCAVLPAVAAGAAGGGGPRGGRRVRQQVEPRPDREVHGRGQLRPAGGVVLEALEVDDEDGGEAVDGQALDAFSAPAATRADRPVVPVEHLLRAERSEAVPQRRHRRRRARRAGRRAPPSSSSSSAARAVRAAGISSAVSTPFAPPPPPAALARQRNREIEEGVEAEADVAAAQAGDAALQLAAEHAGYLAVVPREVQGPRPVRLLLRGQPRDLLVGHGRDDRVGRRGGALL